MTPSSSGDDQRYELLAVKAVDGQLSEDERAELGVYLEQSKERATELAEFITIKETTDAMTERILMTAQIEAPRPRGAARWIQGSSFLVLLCSALILCGYGVFHLFTASELPFLLRFGILVGLSGFFALFSYTLSVRLRGAGKDPYQEIDR